jgi:hypothetical protein
MAKINEKSLEALNNISIEMSTNMEIPGATISYHLTNDSNELQNVISFGSFNVDEDFYNTYATNKEYIINWVVEQLQLNLI